MVDPSDINLSSSPEGVEQRLLDRAVWSYLTAEQVGAERAGGRDVLLKGRLRAALLRLNEWMTEPQAERVIFEIENVNAVGMAGCRWWWSKSNRGGTRGGWNRPHCNRY